MSQTETTIEALAKKLYEADGFNFACLPTDEAWDEDRQDVRDRYLRLASETCNCPFCGQPPSTGMGYDYGKLGCGNTDCPICHVFMTKEKWGARHV